jgi:hypothetical protein
MTAVHRSISVFAMLAFAGTLLAADPFIGTWKLNLAKSKHSAGAPERKEITLVMEDQGGMTQVTVTGTNVDNSPVSVKYVFPANGGVAQVQDSTGSGWDGVAIKRLSDNVREVTYMKGGKVAGTARLTVSADGKTLTRNWRGKNPATGKSATGNEVLDKQE